MVAEISWAALSWCLVPVAMVCFIYKGLGRQYKRGSDCFDKNGFTVNHYDYCSWLDFNSTDQRPYRDICIVINRIRNISVPSFTHFIKIRDAGRQLV